MNQNICLNCGNVCTHTGARNRCPACGAVMTNSIPPEEQKALAHAFALLGESRFDEAKKEFEAMIRQFPDRAEAYWGRLRARYHIVYVLDEDGKALPVCPTVSGKNITEDIDYRKTVECADHVQQAYFQSQAEYIKAVCLEIKISKTASSDFALSQIDINDATPMPQPKQKNKKLPVVLTAFCLIAVIVGVWVGLSSGSASMIGCAHEIFFTPRIEPTCTEKGYTEGESCAICGEIFMEPQPIEPIGHKPNGAPTCLGPSYCELCFMELESASGHEPGTEATCTEPQICLYCGYELEAAWGHDPGHEATCTEAQFCKRCNEELEPAIGHSYNSEITDPTCTEGGYTAYICHCGDSYTANMTPARGHQPGANATCTEASYCAYCGELMQPENGHMPGAEATCTTPQFCLICYAEISPATGHDYQTSVTPPTCTESGYTTHTCHCGETYNDNPEAPTGHSPSGKTLCTDTSFCTVCREELEPAMEHTVTEWTVDRALTESVTGHRHGTCDVCGTTVNEEYTYSRDLYYEINYDGTYTVYRGYCSDPIIIIPSVHDGKTVTAIGESGFSHFTQLTKLYLPETLTKIENYAFAYCSNLGYVLLPLSLTEIGDEAFVGCSGMQSFDIPGNVTSIGNHAFAECDGLTKAVIPDSVTSLGTSVFNSCYNLTEVILGNGAESIPNFMFTDCYKLTAITFGNKVKSIGESAFAYCTSLKTVVIPDTVTEIGAYAFSKCEKLNSVTVGNGVTKIGESAFEDCSALETVSLGTCVTEIGDQAFYFCTALIQIVIPDSVTEIGNNAFDSCSCLTRVVFGNGVTRIGSTAFASCSGLSEIVLPASLKTVSQYAFNSCFNITSVTIPGTVENISHYVFAHCTSLTSVTYEGTVAQWNEIAFGLDWRYNTPFDKVVCTDGEITFN